MYSFLKFDCIQIYIILSLNFMLILFEKNKNKSENKYI